MKSKAKIWLKIMILGLIGAAVFFVWRQKPKTTIVYTGDILIKNAKVLTMDAQSRIYDPGYIVIKDSQIVALGQGQVPAQYGAKKVIDAGGMLAMPGLVNTHAHSPESLERGIDDGQNLSDWLATLSAYEKKFTPDTVYWGSLLASDEMIHSGTTVFNDMFFSPDQTAKAATSAGIRAIVRIPTTDQNGQVTFDDGLAKENESNPLISFSVAPNPLLNYGTTELKQFSDYALAHNYLVHIHFEEDLNARADALKKHQLTPTQIIEQSGLLRNRLLLAHAIDETQDEMDLLAKYPNLGVSFNPKSEAKLDTPLTPVSELLNRGILVGFGSDGAASSNSLDIFGQINFAAYGNLKCIGGDQFCKNGYSVDPEKVVRMATIDGAKILGLDSQIGCLETGKQADIILLNLNQAHLQPQYDIYSTLVYNTSGSDVVDSIIAGKLVMEDQKVLTIDENQLFQKVQNIAKILTTN